MTIAYFIVYFIVRSCQGADWWSLLVQTWAWRPGRGNSRSLSYLLAAGLAVSGAFEVAVDSAVEQKCKECDGEGVY